ncbi:MAG: DUF151 domain-containing protein [Candidatus Aenigmatarchaeota archaeon]
MDRSLIIVLIALFISILSLIVSLYQRELLQDVSELIKIFPQLSTEEYSRVEKIDVIPENGALILYSGCYRLIGYIEDAQIRSISNALQKRRDWRPNTHDVTSDIFKELNIKLIDVRIEEIRNNSYIARAFISQGNKIREIDIRPSDGIALALRLEAPIYIKNSLLISSGEKYC